MRLPKFASSLVAVVALAFAASNIGCAAPTGADVEQVETQSQTLGTHPSDPNYYPITPSGQTNDTGAGGGVSGQNNETGAGGNVSGTAAPTGADAEQVETQSQALGEPSEGSPCRPDNCLTPKG